MPDDNRFEGVADALDGGGDGDPGGDDADSAEDRTDVDTDTDATTSSTDAATETAQEESDSGPATPDDDPAPDPTEPAFGYASDLQKAVYVRPETWSEFEDTLDFDVERILRDHGVREPPKRELHDAMIRVVQEHPEEVAHALLRERGIEIGTTVDGDD